MRERLPSNYSADRNRGLRLTGNLRGEIREKFPKELHIEEGALRDRFEKCGAPFSQRRVKSATPSWLPKWYHRQIYHSRFKSTSGVAARRDGHPRGFNYLGRASAPEVKGKRKRNEKSC
jgi:hypothetical protein